MHLVAARVLAGVLCSRDDTKEVIVAKGLRLRLGLVGGQTQTLDLSHLSVFPGGTQLRASHC